MTTNDAAPPAASTADDAPPFESTRVLVAHTDAVLLRLLADRLAGEGHDVGTAATASTLADAIERQVPDVLVVADELLTEDVDWRIEEESHRTTPPRCVIVGRPGASSPRAVRRVDEALWLPRPFSMARAISLVETAARLRAAERLRFEAAFLDPVTRLADRRTLSGAIEREWTRATRYERPLSCILFDVDHFKRANDEYGHPAGDALLAAAAGVVLENIRETDFAGRFGGDEFVVLLPETGLDGALSCARRILAIVAEREVVHNGSRLAVTMTAGVATRGPGIGTPEQLLEAADASLRCGKREGRNRALATTATPSGEGC